MADTAIPETLAPGLDLFAVTWMQQWVDAGGSIWLKTDGSAQIGWSPYSDKSPSYVEPSPKLSETARLNQRTFYNGFYTGKIRALMELLEASPYGAEAVKSHMRAHGMCHYHGRAGAAS